MNAGRMRGLRRALVGWMRPSVKKVGAVQVGTGVIAVGALFTGVQWQWWLVAALGYFFYACVGHSVGYHRYFAHRSFAAPRWAEVMFTVAGTFGCVGSPVGWAQMHRRHHLYSDVEGDPYTAHRYRYPTPRALLMGGYGTEWGSARALRRMFRADPLQVFVMRWYFAIVAAFAGTLLLVDWRWFVYGWAVPVAWTLWMAGLDAWATHRHGYRNHDTPDGSRNLWWCSLLSWGEGWHNNHHANPRAWSYRERWWEWDLGAVVVWVILWLSKTGERVAARLANDGRASHRHEGFGSGGGMSGAEGADAFGSPRNGRSVMAPVRSSLVPRLWIPAALCVVLFALSWSEEAMADIKLAMSRKPPPDPYELQAPALSPDGTRAALAVSFYGHREHLVLYDIERDTLRVVDKLDHERWRSPSFSPTGDTIAFIRSCTTCEDKGYQLATYDVATGRTKMLTQGSDLHRYMPVYSPSGRFVAYRSKRITWEGDTPDAVAWSAGFRTYTFATNVDRRVPLERFDVGGFWYAKPSGFLNEHTFLFTAIGPDGLRPRDRGALFRRLESFVGEREAGIGWYGYRLELSGKGKLELLSPNASGPLGKVTTLAVSADTGRLAIIDKSYRPPNKDAFFGYDVFVSDGEGEAFRQATSLRTHMARLTFSKSGNRIAFLADDTRKQHWSLWILEVETGRVWETDLKRRLEDWYRSVSER